VNIEQLKSLDNTKASSRAKTAFFVSLLGCEIPRFKQKYPEAEARGWPMPNSPLPLRWVYVYYEELEH
jgi:hypothetical protein